VAHREKHNSQSISGGTPDSQSILRGTFRLVVVLMIMLSKCTQGEKSDDGGRTSFCGQKQRGLLKKAFGLFGF
jgi:hypothetical protein